MCSIAVPGYLSGTAMLVIFIAIYWALFEK